VGQRTQILEMLLLVVAVGQVLLAGREPLLMVALAVLAYNTLLRWLITVAVAVEALGLVVVAV
jgi:hypothetical protein